MKDLNHPHQAYDIIGDIHGHAAELEQLLEILGYYEADGYYRHPEGRKVLFLGDYIDRGPEIRRVLQIVRGMIDAGEAQGILGNHEVNALCFHMCDANKKPYRPHTEANVKQHAATLDQVANVDEPFWESTLEWFRSLPLWINLEGIRAVHACWSQFAMARLSCGLSLSYDTFPIPEIGHIHGQSRFSDHHLESYSKKRTDAHGQAMDEILCGPELKLPDGMFFETADKKLRREIRYCWWENELIGKKYSAVAFPMNSVQCDATIEDSPSSMDFSASSPITFFGHYALMANQPARILDNLACLDYGMAKGGLLVAYRWDGEASLDNSKFISIPQRKANNG